MIPTIRIPNTGHPWSTVYAVGAVADIRFGEIVVVLNELHEFRMPVPVSVPLRAFATCAATRMNSVPRSACIPWISIMIN
ncbi:hypothetical protein [Bifidobacterium jacchi]|uniref:Uncharacterized protein n=1 Tax=Bifidobacterium jacchi TaxID=2490545 RepID=A0A5N5RLZ9_9BIFI|nr:hypothetical protein [Bifidobacterium jacchi]KAB5608366.1 hypothetical protein EHS19_01720 [Bifidobacterium jacchi]